MTTGTEPAPSAAPAHRVRDHCLAPSRAAGVSPTYAGKYGRLFPDLPPFDGGEALVFALGRAGACDGTPWAAQGGDDATGAAGWPFFGQLVAHDITADRSPLAPHADVETIRNFRTPRANLENLYGAGQAAPYLFDRTDAAKFLLGTNDAGRPDDLPRNSQGTALIGDARDDSHIFVSQLHLALMKAHNGLVDRLRQDGAAVDDLFEEARRATVWHYQWLIVHDFLPRIPGQALVDDLLRHGPRCYRPAGEAYIPFEFADAAYRYGHSQIRHRFKVNDGAPELPIFPDLIGFRAVPAALAVDWSYLFDLPGPASRAEPDPGPGTRRPTAPPDSRRSRSTDASPRP